MSNLCPVSYNSNGASLFALYAAQSYWDTPQYSSNTPLLLHLSRSSSHSLHLDVGGGRCGCWIGLRLLGGELHSNQTLNYKPFCSLNVFNMFYSENIWLVAKKKHKCTKDDVLIEIASWNGTEQESDLNVTLSATNEFADEMKSVWGTEKRCTWYLTDNVVQCFLWYTLWECLLLQVTVGVGSALSCLPDWTEQRLHTTLN